MELPEMAGGDWRAFSLRDGEKEEANESTRETVFGGIGHRSNA
jgi:hypothetical protein